MSGASEEPVIRIVLVDDHPLFRQGLRRVLDSAPDCQVIGEVADGESAVETILELCPDVVVMDINLPGMNGLQVTREVTGKKNDIRFIILTAFHNADQVFHAIRAGASAYFPKDVDSQELLEAVRQVHQGNYVVNGEVMTEQKLAAWLLKQLEERNTYGGFEEDMFVPLSPREMEILVLITRGYSNKEIAYRLGISRQTVKNHMTSILRKLQVNDRTQAAVYALRHGWIRLQDIEE